MGKRGEKTRRPAPVAGLVERAVALGAKAAKVVDASTIATAPWVRMKCRYGCGCWESSVCCPPRSPTPEETRKVIDSYARAILFEAGGGETKRIAVALEREAFLAGHYKAFGHRQDAKHVGVRQGRPSLASLAPLASWRCRHRRIPDRARERLRDRRRPVPRRCAALLRRGAGRMTEPARVTGEA